MLRILTDPNATAALVLQLRGNGPGVSRYRNGKLDLDIVHTCGCSVVQVCDVERWDCLGFEEVGTRSGKEAYKLTVQKKRARGGERRRGWEEKEREGSKESKHA